MIKLSPSSLNLFLECPRCFWLRFNKGISRPSGPSSTLPSGMDYTLKNYYDYCRKNGLPPQLKGLIKGKLISDQEKVSEMRKRSFGFELNKDVWFGGALDEALEFEDDSINVRISGLKFYTKDDGQKTLAHLAEITQIQTMITSTPFKETLPLLNGIGLDVE